MIDVDGAGRLVLTAITITAKFAKGAGVLVVVTLGKLLDGSGTVIDVDGAGRLVLIARTIAAIFDTGAGV